MKKSVSALLAIIMIFGFIFGFTACSGKEEPSNPASDNEVTETVEETDADEETTLPEALEATDDDFDYLCTLMCDIAIEYDRNSSTAVADAYNITIGHMGIYYHFFDDMEGFSGTTADPKGYFHSEYDSNLYEYYTVPEASADWIIENVMGIEPDHNLDELYPYEGATGHYMYYYDGYYYVSSFIGDSYISGAKVVDYEVYANGIYELDIEVYETDIDEEYLSHEAEVTAELKEIDGRRLWVFHEIDIDYPDYY